MPKELIQHLRDTCEKLRRTPMPLELVIPDLQTAADALEAMSKELGAKQAQIDRLMLEYCPEEMTRNQLYAWAKNQRPAIEPKKHPAIDAAFARDAK